MTAIEIEYCVPCGLLDRAIATQTRLLDEFGQKLDSVSLVPSHGGVFIVTVDGETIWDKSVHGAEMDMNLIVNAIDDRISVDA
ncbi:SelT/SelW/SelH family protein [Haladaptatus sp. DFWS20]|uniref:SelT/SelW/SelH family protein n=1 Tax=Haladaptatus sp. DFWS20 TaxID=3403467 RepID=UPI003EB9A179